MDALNNLKKKLISYNGCFVWSFVKKEVVFLGVMCYLKFTEEAHVLLLGEFVVATVELMRSQKVKFLSKLCWNP